MLLRGISKHRISTDRVDKGYFHREETEVQSKARVLEVAWHSHKAVSIVQYGLCSLYVRDTCMLASIDGNIEFCWFSVQWSDMAF